MTGFGDARGEDARVSVAVEVRAVNNRYLKVTMRLPEAYALLEPEIEKLIRERVTRGTVSLVLRVDPVEEAAAYTVHGPVLEAYWRQLNRLAETIHLAMPKDLGSLLGLPGVVAEATAEFADPQSDWPLIRRVISQALDRFHEFRVAEGQSMGRDLCANLDVIAREIRRVHERAPKVVGEFRDRLLERVRELLADSNVQIDSADLLREISIFAERCDVNEELMRLRSHLEQFLAFLEESSSQGRKLDFLSQEMFREVNTIGSKANDVTIAHAVVEMKAAVDRLREVLQNVE